MAYLGRGLDKISNVEVLDNITFDGSSSYTLQKNSVNFTPSSANTLLLSIDGVVQAGNFTVSGSTIDFGTAVAGTSTCDFVLHYGVGLVTTVADGAITAAKLGANSVTSAKLNNDIISGATALTSAPADTDEFLVSDAGTLKRIDYSLIKGGGKVNQVIVSTSEATEAGTDSYNSYADFSSNPTISITPSAASSKILIEFSAIFSIGNSSSGGDVAICDSSNNVLVEQGMYGNKHNNLVLWKLHSANTTSEVTYKIRGKVNSSGGHFIYLNSKSSNPTGTAFWKATEILA